MAQPSDIVKTYSLINQHTFSTHDLELQHNGQTFLWVTNGRGGLFSSDPPVTLHNSSPEGPIIAAAKFSSIASGIRVLLGDPHAASSSSAAWAELYSSMTGREYNFTAPDGHDLVWRRTHNSALGASHFSQGDYKLLDPANEERVLAVYLADHKAIGSNATGQINWLVELPPQVELFVLTAILMIEAQLRRQRRRQGANGPGAGMNSAGNFASAAAGGI